MTGRQVLVVEDDSRVALDLQTRISQLGYSVVGLARSGITALDMAVEVRPDLILLDISLAGWIDGIEVGKRLQQATGVGIIYLTEHLDAATLHQAGETNPLGYLMKPFSDRELEAALVIASSRLDYERRLSASLAVERDQRMRLEAAVERRSAHVRQMKDRLAAILDASADVILLLSPGGQVEIANHQVYSMFGFERGEIEGAAMDILFDPPTAQELGRALADTAEQATPQRCEVVAYHKTGAPLCIEVSLAPITEAGRVEGVVCSLRDIGALKELALMKEEFIANVSHELRTPIASLKVIHEVMRRIPEQREAYLPLLEREIERLRLMVENLLAIARLDQGHTPLNAASVDLNRLVSTYLEDWKALAEQQQLSLALHLADDLPAAAADETMIGEALGVLLTNAFNYTPPGGQVTIRTGSGMLDGVMTGVITVSDTGPGIPADEQAKVFERFYRGTASRMANISGTGLGLAIAKEIAERHGGRMSVESSGVPGDGATFTLHLPAAGQPAVEEEPEKVYAVQ